MNIKEKINKLCREKGWTQRQLASQLGKEPSNLHNQISNEETIQLGLVKNICKALDTTIELLTSDNDNVEDDAMVHDQLEKIMLEGDKEAVDIIIGKIAREYMNVQRLGKQHRSSSAS